jgi:hypothetical protein
MPQQIITNACDFSPNDIIKYTPAKLNKSGGKSIGILNKLVNTPLRLVTPVLLTWGASDYEGNERFEMSIQFPTEEYSTPELTKFLDNMKDFEKMMKDDALRNSKDWFNKNHKGSEVIDALWTPMLKYPKNKVTLESDYTKAPSLRVKIPKWDGKWKCDIYDENHNKLFSQYDPNNGEQLQPSPIDYLTKGKNIAVMMVCGGLWFANGKFGVTWKLVQAVVQPPKNALEDKCYIKLSDTDKQGLRASSGDENTNNDSCVIVEDSDEEEEEEVVVEDDDEEEEVVEEVVEEVEEINVKKSPTKRAGRAKKI